MRYRKGITGDMIRNLISHYEKGTNLIFRQIEDGVCGYGVFAMKADEYKWMIVQEYPVSEWVSHHKVSLCNKLPKVWEQKIEKLGY